MGRLPRGMPEPLRRYARLAVRQGWSIESSRRASLIWITPDGVRLRTTRTPSDWRGIKNFVSLLRRHGLRTDAWRLSWPDCRDPLTASHSAATVGACAPRVRGVWAAGLWTSA